MAVPVRSNLDFESTTRGVNVPDPSTALDMCNKQYADSLVVGAAKRFSATFGDGAATQYDIVHSLGSTDIDVTIKVVSSGVCVMCDVTALSSTTVRLNFVAAPASNSLRCTVVA